MRLIPLSIGLCLATASILRADRVQCDQLEFEVPGDWTQTSSAAASVIYRAHSPDGTRRIAVVETFVSPQPDSFSNFAVIAFMRTMEWKAGSFPSSTPMTIDERPAESLTLNIKTDRGVTAVPELIILHSPGIYAITLAGFDEAAQKSFVATLRLLPSSSTRAGLLRSRMERLKHTVQISSWVILGCVGAGFLVRTLIRRRGAPRGAPPPLPRHLPGEH